MKLLDIAIKDLLRSYRSTIGLVFMFVVPLLVTGMFYFMFGNIAGDGGFSIPAVKVVIADLDEGGPSMQAGAENIPGGIKADTLGELIVEVLRSEDLASLLEVSLAPDAASARLTVDSQQAHVAIIIPPDFSRQFADQYGKASVEYYQDPTLTIGPSIVKSIMNQFMDRISGIKIAVDVALDQMDTSQYALIGEVIERFLDTSETQTEDLSQALLEVRSPVQSQQEDDPLARMLGPIMGGMMIFFAFYTGTATAESILREEEERTLPRLFTTPTPQSTILGGKFLSVFLTVAIQIAVLLTAAHLLFRIEWGQPAAVALMAAGVVFSAASFGIFINSMLRDSKQGSVIFGGVLTLSGMIGMISIFAMNSPTAARLGDTVSLLVPQGWAVRGLMMSMNSSPLPELSINFLVMLGWSAAFFVIGVWRFNRRYA